MARMTEVLFVEVSARRLELRLCEIAERLYSEGHRVQILAGTQEEAAQLDRLLWSFRPDSFVPHGLVEQGLEGSNLPVVITTRPERLSEFDHLLMLEFCSPEVAGSFARAIHLVVKDDPERLAASRHYWTQLKAAGFTLNHERLG